MSISRNIRTFLLSEWKAVVRHILYSCSEWRYVSVIPTLDINNLRLFATNIWRRTGTKSLEVRITHSRMPLRIESHLIHTRLWLWVLIMNVKHGISAKTRITRIRETQCKSVYQKPVFLNVQGIFTSSSTFTYRVNEFHGILTLSITN